MNATSFIIEEIIGEVTEETVIIFKAFQTAFSTLTLNESQKAH